jgi:hypothetical protein
MITPQEKEKIIQTLKEENLEEFQYIINSADPNTMLNRLVSTKRTIENVLQRFNRDAKTAFEKADNSKVYVYIDSNNIPAELTEPLELSFEEFINKYKPILVWHKGGRGTYSVPLGKYSYFARNYKIVLFRVSPIDNNTIKIATKLSIYKFVKGNMRLYPKEEFGVVK